jgi:hypothetical protein
MAPQSLLDRLLSFLPFFYSEGAIQMIPNLLFHLVLVFLAFAGWRRHHAPGFLLLLVAWSFALGTDVLYLGLLAAHGSISYAQQNLVHLARALGSISWTFTAAGLWQLVYRTRVLPSEPGREP